jgi:adenosine deaminase
VRVTLDTLAPDRIGHGIRSTEDPTVLDEIVSRDITLEVCPGSNVALGVYEDAAKVPLRELIDAGARLALGADDPLLFGSRLTDQYRLAREAHGLDDAALAALARSSLLGSRAPSDVLDRALADVDAWLAAPEPR